MESRGFVTERPVETTHEHAMRRPSAEDIAWVGLWPAALALLAAILWLAPPLSDLYPEPSRELFTQWQPQVVPEPLETTRFLLALAAPFVLAGLVLLGSAAQGDRRFDPAVIALQIAGIALIAWGVGEQVNGPFLLFPPDYFEPLLLSVPILAGGVVIGVALTTFVVVATRSGRLDLPASIPSGWREVAVAAAVLLSALWLLPALVTEETVGASGPLASGHIPVQGADYFAVVNGRTPFVDYVPQYAHLLPLALAPLLSAFGLSLTSLSVLMTALSLVALLALFGVLLRVTERPVAALALYVPVLAFSLFPWTDEGLVRESNSLYYGFFPGRYLGPFVVGWLCALAVRGRRLPVWLLFFVAGLAALNNAEFGGPTVIAAFAAVVLGRDRTRPQAQTVRALLAHAVIGLVAALALVTAVTLVRAGELPDLGSLTYYSRLFGREAFGLVPMPTLGLHIGMYLTFVAALLVAAVRHVQARHDSTLTAMLAFVGVFGLVASAYFAGRSLPWQLMLLFPLWGLALALLAWVAVQSLSAAGAARSSPARSLLPSFAALCGFGVMVASIATFPPPWTQVERLSQSGSPVYEVHEVQRFVEERTNTGEAILLLGTQTDHRVAERAGVTNVSPWNYWLSLFSEQDVDRALDALAQENGSKVFLDQRTDPLRLGLLSDRGPVTALLRARGYRHVGDPDGQLALFER